VSESFLDESVDALLPFLVFIRNELQTFSKRDIFTPELFVRAKVSVNRPESQLSII
jgi:hypothetical protein